MGCVFAYVIVLALVGPEKLGHKFGVAHDSDLADAAGTNALARVVGDREGEQFDEASSGSDRDAEKGGKVDGQTKEFVG